MNTNEKLDSYQHSTLSIIEHLQKSIAKKYNVKINFHDVIGFCVMNASLNNLFLPYVYHDNVFCNTIKKNEKCFFRCVMNKDLVARKSEKVKKPFFGACHMGVEEFVFPVIKNNRVLALFFIGQFCEDKKNAENKLQRAARETQIEYNELLEKYQSVCKENTINIEELTADMAVLCKLVILSLNEYGFDINDDTILMHFSNKILQTANDFINNNYKINISLRVVAAACFCNPVYLSKLFKNKMGMTVTDYINSIRIKHSKSLMVLTDSSITEIAYQVGFNDSSYFTRVFKRYVGISPKKYRSRS